MSGGGGGSTNSNINNGGGLPLPRTCPSPSLSPTLDSEASLHRSLVAWCVRDLQPISSATKPGFVTMARDLNPRFLLPTTEALKDVLHRLHDASVAQVPEVLCCFIVNLSKGKGF